LAKNEAFKVERADVFSKMMFFGTKMCRGNVMTFFLLLFTDSRDPGASLGFKDGFLRARFQIEFELLIPPAAAWRWEGAGFISSGPVGGKLYTNQSLPHGCSPRRTESNRHEDGESIKYHASYMIIQSSIFQRKTRCCLLLCAVFVMYL
jgi:hypothetical protein